MMTDLKQPPTFFQPENPAHSNNMASLALLKQQWENETERLNAIKQRIVTAVNTASENLSSEKTTSSQRQYYESELKKAPVLLTEVERQLTACSEKLAHIHQVLQSTSSPIGIKAGG